MRQEHVLDTDPVESEVTKRLQGGASMHRAQIQRAKQRQSWKNQ